MRTHRLSLVILAMIITPALMFGGTVSGKVTYTGTPAKSKAIDMSKEPSCAKQHATPVTTETVVTGANNLKMWWSISRLGPMTPTLPPRQ